MSLYEELPKFVVVSGVEYPVNTDFRFWINFQNVFLSQDDINQKSKKISKIMKKIGLPITKESLDAMLGFYVGESIENASREKSNGQYFDFEKDSEYIFSAFLESYGIDLTTAQLHWWQFKALFKSLPEDCQMCKIMMYRAVDLKNVPAEQRKFYRDMKARYSLGNKENHKYKTNQEMKDYVAKRFEETKKRVSELRGNK